MGDDLKKTLRLRLPWSSGSGDDDQSNPDGPFRETEVELISTQQLHKLLEEDAKHRKDLEAAAEGKDGVLARNVENDRFEIVDEAEVAAALARAQESRPLDVTSTELAELNEDGQPALVSTMMLKVILGPEGEVELSPVGKKRGDTPAIDPDGDD